MKLHELQAGRMVVTAKGRVGMVSGRPMSRSTGVTVDIETLNGELAWATVEDLRYLAAEDVIDPVTGKVVQS